MNFPSRHPLNQSARARGLIGPRRRDPRAWNCAISGARFTASAIRSNAPRSRSPNPVSEDDQHRRRRSLPAVQLSGLPALRRSRSRHRRRRRGDAAVADRSGEGADRRRRPQAAFEARGKKLAEAACQVARCRRATEATYAWDASPISTGAALRRTVGRRSRTRIGRLLSAVTRHFYGCWPQRLWDYRTSTITIIGDSGGAGVGYGARRHRRRGAGQQEAWPPDRQHQRRWRSDVFTRRHCGPPRITSIPLLIVDAQQPRLSPGTDACAAHGQPAQPRHRPRPYRHHADRSGRSISPSWPKAMGVHAEGPITDPKELGPALKRAVARVKSGEPALLDVVTQPR